MKKTRFREEQIIGVLKRAEAGQTVAEICRGQGISEATFSRWKAQYGTPGQRLGYTCLVI